MDVCESLWEESVAGVNDRSWRFAVLSLYIRGVPLRRSPVVAVLKED